MKTLKTKHEWDEQRERGRKQKWRHNHFIDDMWSNDRDPMCISFHAMLFYPCRIVTIFVVVISHRRQFSNSHCHRAAVVHHKLDKTKKTLTNEWVICGTISISFWSFWKMFIFVSGWTVTRGHGYTFWYNELQRARLCITLLWLCVCVCKCVVSRNSQRCIHIPTVRTKCFATSAVITW